MVQVNLIWAQARNGVIGHQGKLPWHLPQDLAHFKAMTTHHPVIMGRKTWYSLPPRFRPLPHRHNIVVTQQTDWRSDSPQVTVAHSVADALSTSLLGNHVQQVWVIGGGEIYREFLPYAQRLEITEIQADVTGDTFAPVLTREQWAEVHRSHQQSPEGLAFDFVTYQRVASPTQLP